MTWFRFEKPFDFVPKAKGGRVTVAYKPGVYNVTRECAAAAKTADAGKTVRATKSDGEETGRG